MGLPHHHPGQLQQSSLLPGGYSEQPPVRVSRLVSHKGLLGYYSKQRDNLLVLLLAYSDQKVIKTRAPNELYLQIALHCSCIHQMEYLPRTVELLLHAFCSK